MRVSSLIKELVEQQRAYGCLLLLNGPWLVRIGPLACSAILTRNTPRTCPQVEAGAQIIDINFDEGLLDSVAAMTRFVNLLVSEPEVRGRCRYCCCCCCCGGYGCCHWCHAGLPLNSSLSSLASRAQWQVSCRSAVV